MALNCSLLFAQTEFDAIKLELPDLYGSARYMGMAGAFGALGGDASSIKDNPAGLGIYRTSELSTTLNFLNQTTTSNWPYYNSGLNDSFSKEKSMNLGINNLAYIIANSTNRSRSGNEGLLNSNWSFTFDKIKSFDRSATIESGYSPSSITQYMAYFSNGIKSTDMNNSSNPFDNTELPWISIMGYQGYLINETINPTSGKSEYNSLLNTNEKVQPLYSITEAGSINEYSIGWSGNFSNKLYLGVTFNFQSVDYSMLSTLTENFADGGNMKLTNILNTSGAGVNLNLGTIYRPSDILRLGFSVHTPMVYGLTDVNSAIMNYNLSSTNYGNFQSPEYSTSYFLATPWKIDVSGALLFGKKGLISAEYVNSFNTESYFYDSNGSQSFKDENAGMISVLKDVQTIKFGGEYKLNSNFSLRAGYAYITSGSHEDADKLMRYNTTRTDTEYFQHFQTNFYSLGFGYRESNWFMDCAFMSKLTDEIFYPYNSNLLANKANSALVQTLNNNFVLTLGLKF